MATNYSNNNISAIKLQNKEYKIKSIPFHGTHDEWLINSSYIPKQGEIIIYDIDSNYNYERIKIGDGVTSVTDLPFYLENEVEGDDCSVLYIVQSLTKDQKTQARINIDALGVSDIVSDEEFLAWLFEVKVVEPLMTASGEIYASNNNEIYVL